MSSLLTTKSQKTLNKPHLQPSLQANQTTNSTTTTNQRAPRYALDLESVSPGLRTFTSIPTSPTRTFKRKMDLNSQLQAAASYTAAMNMNMNTNTNGSMMLNNHHHHNHNHDQDHHDLNPPIKKTRTNTPWSADEEKRLKELRDVGTSWSEIAKSFPNRTEGSVKKHWYKDMHYAEFTDEEKNSLFDAIREYDANKWKSIGNKVGKPAKACEQFAREHFNGR